MKHIGTVSKLGPKTADEFQFALCQKNVVLAALLGDSTFKGVVTEKCDLPGDIL